MVQLQMPGQEGGHPPPDCFALGRVCAARTQLYHLLYHFEHKLLAKLRREAGRAAAAEAAAGEGEAAAAAAEAAAGGEGTAPAAAHAVDSHQQESGEEGQQQLGGATTPAATAAAAAERVRWDATCSRVVKAQARPLLRAYQKLIAAAESFVQPAARGGGWGNSMAYQLDGIDSVLARLAA